MKYRGRTFRPAQVDVLASLILLRVFEHGEGRRLLGEQLRGLERSQDPANLVAAEQVRDALTQMRQVREEWQSDRAELHGPGSVGGTAEPRSGDEGTESAASPQVPLTVAEVAEKLCVSRRYVRKLITGERLSATKPGGAWLVDAGSVAEYLAGRPIDEQAGEDPVGPPRGGGAGH